MKTKQINVSQLETHLWDTANFLRNTIDAGDYKGYIFPILFLKRISDVYDEEYQKALDESDGDREYAKSDVHHRFQIPDGCHWNDLRNISVNVGQKILKIQRELQKDNPILFGIFGDVNWGNKERLSDETLVNLIEHFSKLQLSTEHVTNDLMGMGYEFLVKKFADDSGHTAAEFYTNRSIVDLMTQLLDPQQNESVYDPTCGTGGMLLGCINYLKNLKKDFRTLKLFGQEKNAITSGIAKMNFFLHGIDDVKIIRGDTLSNPAFIKNDKLQKFDVILANPPYSVNRWDRNAWGVDPFGRNIYGTPPQGRADYAFIQHIINSMSETGRAAVLVPHGVLFRDEEKEIRKKLVEDDKLEAVIGLPGDMFYNSVMQASIMIFTQNKKKKRQVLFINAVDLFERSSNKNFFNGVHIKKIQRAYQAFENIDNHVTEGYPNVICDFAYSADFEEIKQNNFLLSIPLYTRYRMKNKAYNPKSEVVNFYKKNSKISEILESFLKKVKYDIKK